MRGEREEEEEEEEEKRKEESLQTIKRTSSRSLCAKLDLQNGAISSFINLLEEKEKRKKRKKRKGKGKGKGRERKRERKKRKPPGYKEAVVVEQNHFKKSIASSFSFSPSFSSFCVCVF